MKIVVFFSVAIGIPFSLCFSPRNFTYLCWDLPHRTADKTRLALWRQRLASLEREQKQTLLDLCLRRDQLRVAERTRLFRSAAQYFESRLELAPDEYESDEKFVLQLAAVLSEQGPQEDVTRPRRT